MGAWNLENLSLATSHLIGQFLWGLVSSLTNSSLICQVVLFFLFFSIGKFARFAACMCNKWTHMWKKEEVLSGEQRWSANSRIYGFLPNCNYIPRSFSVLPKRKHVEGRRIIYEEQGFHFLQFFSLKNHEHFRQSNAISHGCFLFSS